MKYIRNPGLIVYLLVCFCLCANAQGPFIKKPKIPLTDSMSYDLQTGGTEPLFIEHVWKNAQGDVDSILWRTYIQPDLVYLKKFKAGEVNADYLRIRAVDSNKLSCASASDTLLYIFQFKSTDSTHIRLLKRFNPFLDHDISVSYHLDTVKSYVGREIPPGKITNVYFEFSICYENALVKCPISIALNPFKGAVTYNDPKINDMYLVASKNRSRKFTFEKATYRLVQNKVAPVFKPANVTVVLRKTMCSMTTNLKTKSGKRKLICLGTLYLLSRKPSYLIVLSPTETCCITRFWQAILFPKE